MRWGVAIIACVVLGGAGTASAQFFSPGPLARPHAGLEGLENCSRCHEQQRGLSARLCLGCHTELAPRIDKKAGFHGRLPEAKRSECASCHPDHRGRDFAMVEWDPSRDRFDHRKTGWPLQGAHARTRCDQCHERRLVVDAAIRQMLDKQPQRTTSLGLSTRCDACHFDEHRGQLGRDCAKCHNESAWKPVPSFNHQSTAYPLRGKHRDVACAKCHPNQADESTRADAFPRPRASAFMQMKPIEHRTCESCHEDPHRGSFGPACSRCHSEAGWKIIQVGADKDTAFHEKTRYPLRGGHVAVPCRSCHGPFPGQPARFRGLPFQACTDCHEDAHLGQLRNGAGLTDCAKCHTVNGFSPPRYEREQHASTRFPLEGGHQSASCRGCHPVDDKLQARVPATLLRKLKVQRRPALFSLAVLHPRAAPEACASCHQDVHRGQFAGDKDCARCHRTTSFADLGFDHDHDSRFRLTGKHATTACASCHHSERPRGGPAVVRYRPLETACSSCHLDVHRGQFTSAATHDAEGGKPRDCDGCHQTSDFKKTLFVHNDRRFTTYPLEGKHAQVTCARCHPTVQLGGGVATVRYRPLPRDCEGCHVDFHKGEFRGFEP